MDFFFSFSSKIFIARGGVNLRWSLKGGKIIIKPMDINFVPSKNGRSKRFSLNGGGRLEMFLCCQVYS